MRGKNPQNPKPHCSGSQGRDVSDLLSLAGLRLERKRRRSDGFCIVRLAIAVTSRHTSAAPDEYRIQDTFPTI